MRRALVNSILLLAGCGVSGNGVLASEDRAVSGFDSVQLTLPIATLIVEGPLQVTISADSNLLPLITTQLDGSTLELESTSPIWGHLDTALITVHMPSVRSLGLSGSGRLDAPHLHPPATLALASSGSGEMNVSTSSKALERTAIAASGSGSVTLATVAGTVDASLSGSGGIKLSGSADRVVYELSGAGSIEAAALMTKDGKVSLEGSGSITMSANGGTVSVKINGSGNVTLSGNSMATVDSNGSGHFVQH